jgi:ATP-dependent protease ClpP protease subunit
MPEENYPTEGMIEEAQRGLEWRREYGRGGTAIGVARARDIANRANLSDDTVRRMNSYFSRHEVDKKGQGFSPGEDGYPSAGRIAWALWGGDPGQTWAAAWVRRNESDNSTNGTTMNLIQIENRTGKVKLNDAVTPWSSDDLIGDIDRLYGAKAVAENLRVGEFTAKADDALETLEIEINSPGGSVLDGYRVYHSLMGMRERGVRVIATGNGIVASMASVIFMAADERRITQGSRIMIHEAQQTVSGDSSDHARAAKILDEMSDEIAAIYSGVTGADKDEMRELMREETWMGATEAVDRKFADSIVGKSPVDIRDNGQKSKTTSMSILDRLLPNGELQSKLDFANGELVAKDTEIQSLTAKLTEADHLIASAIDEVAEFKAQAETSSALAKAEAEAHDATKTELATAQSASAPEVIEAKAVELASAENPPEAIQKVIASRVTEELAAAGHDKPIANTETDVGCKTMPRAEFNNLSHPKRNAFIREGGKITD